MPLSVSHIHLGTGKLGLGLIVPLIASSKNKIISIVGNRSSTRSDERIRSISSHKGYDLLQVAFDPAGGVLGVESSEEIPVGALFNSMRTTRDWLIGHWPPP